MSAEIALEVEKEACCCTCSSLLGKCCNLVCCFGFLTLCGCRQRITSKLVFFPPRPFYEFEEDAKAGPTIWLVNDEGEKVEPYASDNLTIGFIRNKKGNRVAYMSLVYPGSTTTIIYSHGNAADLGCLRDHLIDLAYNTKTSVFAYDYTGYGLSDGTPSYADTLSDCEAVYAYVREMDTAKRIIVYGQSLGSGPSLHLGKKYKDEIAGIVIHSGLMSCIRVIREVDRTYWFDIFPNIDNVTETAAPVFIIHGTEDEDISIAHGVALKEAAPVSYKPWFVRGGGHNNIEIVWRSEYFAKLGEYVRSIEARTSDNLTSGPLPSDELTPIVTGVSV